MRYLLPDLNFPLESLVEHSAERSEALVVLFEGTETINLNELDARRTIILKVLEVSVALSDVYDMCRSVECRSWQSNKPSSGTFRTSR